MRRYLPAILAVLVIIIVGIAAFAMGEKKTDKTVTATTTAAGETMPDVSEDDRAPQLKGIGVVDVVALMRDSVAAQSIEKQLNDKRKSYQDELAAQEKKLRSMEEALVKDPKKGTPEFNDKRKKFEASVRDLQKNAQQKRMNLDRAAGKAVAELQAEITKITAETANSKNLQMVLTRDQVVIVSKPLDITTEVMTQLNKELTSVSVNVTDAKAAAPAPAADSKE